MSCFGILFVVCVRYFQCFLITNQHYYFKRVITFSSGMAISGGWGRHFLGVVTCKISRYLLLLLWLHSFIPESARWLLKRGRYTEAMELLSKVARLNGKKMPDGELCLPKEERLGDIRDLFSSLKMAHKTIGIWLMW